MPESIHHTDFPQVNESLIDTKLEEEMLVIQKVVEMGRATRWEKKIKVRQPLSKLYIKLPQMVTLSESAQEELLTDIREELNIKEIEFKSDMSEFIYYSLKPDFKGGVGKKLGNKVKDLQKALQQMESTHKLAVELMEKGSIELELDVQIYEKNEDGKKVPVGTEKETLSLEKDDFIIEEHNRENVVVNTDFDYIVALDVTLTPELIEEGLVRDIIRHIQETRKSKGFEIEDRIKISFDVSDKVKNALSKHSDYIKEEILAVDIEFPEGNGAKEKKGIVTIDLKEFDSNNIEKVSFHIDKA